MPREIICKEPRKPIIEKYEEDAVEAGRIRVRTAFASPKHGTEMHIFRDDAPQAIENYDEEYHLFLPKTEQGTPKPYDFRPGNMWVGEVIEIGAGVEDFRIGDRIAGYGPLRETHTICASDALIMPEGMSWQQAVCYDPCQFAMSAIRDAHLRLGDACLITGLGAIGLMAAQMAKLAGAKLVVVSDPIQIRREIALKNGADAAFNPAAVDVGLEIKKMTDRLGADVVLETSGTYPALQQALRAVAYGGRIAVAGWYSPCKGGLNLGREAHFNNATVFFSRACSEPNPDYPRWSWDRVNRECWTILKKNLIACDDVINPIVPFEEAAEAYLEYVDRHPEKSVKMGVKFQEGIKNA